jgi:hypothetical protein
LSDFSPIVKPRWKKRPTRVLAQIVGDGLIEIAGFADFERFMRRKYRGGEQVMIEVKRSRNPYFHRLVMGLIHKLAHNVDEFADDTERALLILKIKLGRATPIAIADGSVGWIPESIAFDMMEDGEFHVFFDALCDLIALEYWPTMTAAQVKGMADMLARRERE